MSKTQEISNESGLEFTDISSEEWREYTFPGDEKIRIENPVCLNVSENGHRVFDASGISHYIPMKWTHLCWKAKEGEPSFVR